MCACVHVCCVFVCDVCVMCVNMSRICMYNSMMCVNIPGTHVIVYIYVCVCLYIYVCDQTCKNQLCEHKIFGIFFKFALSYVHNLNLSILTQLSTYLLLN